MRRILIIISFLILIASSVEAAISRDVKQGNRLYKAEKYEESLEKYKAILEEDPEKDIINFNAGSAYYKTKDYENAATHFRKALLGKDENLKTNAYYNLGNSLYKLGLNKEEQELESAVQLLKYSLSEYEKSLALNPEDKVVESNHTYVSKELERLKEKLQKQQQEQNKTCPLPPKDNQNEQKKDQEKQKTSKDKNEQETSSSREDQNKEKEQEQKSAKDKQSDKNSDDQSAQEEQGNEEEKPPEQKEAQKQGDDGEEQEQNGNSAGSLSNENAIKENPKEMSEQEYQMFLNDYQQKEEPRGLLNMQPRSIRYKSTDKDW